jgi:hypothetical protein
MHIPKTYCRARQFCRAGRPSYPSIYPSRQHMAMFDLCVSIGILFLSSPSSTTTPLSASSFSVSLARTREQLAAPENTESAATTTTLTDRRLGQRNRTFDLGSCYAPHAALRDFCAFHALQSGRKLRSTAACLLFCQSLS